MISLPLDAVTPTLYALAEKFAERIYILRKDSIRQFLNQEERIYEAAFKFYVFAKQVGMGSGDNHRFFADYLHNHLILDDEEDRIKILSEPIHQEYWLMAQSDSYWLDGRRCAYEGIDRFSIVIGKWRENEKKKLEDKQTRMSELRRALTT